MNNPTKYTDPTGYTPENTANCNNGSGSAGDLVCTKHGSRVDSVSPRGTSLALQSARYSGVYSSEMDYVTSSPDGDPWTVTNGDANVQKAHSLSFDGKALRWIDGEGNVVDEWDAISGRPSRGGGRSKTKDYTGAGSQSLEDKGPIPEGTWAVRVERFQVRNQSGWQEFKGALGWSAWPGGHDSWGDYRVWLEPLGNTNTYGRSGFSIHGGVIPGSAGCIDLCGMMPSFAQRFQSYGQDMVLTVKY